MDLESIMEARRKAVQESIQQVPADKLTNMESEIFPYFEHQWREPFEQFLKDHPGCPIYHANAGEGVQILYCPSADRGIWFIPHGGLGPLQAEGLKMMKEAVEKRK
jgi:hypothetical protein